jgi:hypothetical protein
MTRLQSLGTPILTQVGPMRYTDLIDLFDAQVVKGRHYAVKTRWLADLTPRHHFRRRRSGRYADVIAFDDRTAPFPRGRRAGRP